MMGVRRRILVVDDDEHLRDAICQILEDEGYTVVEAANGRQALAILAAPGDRPDLVLLDLMMPDMNGEELIRHVQSDVSLADLRIIVVTAMPEFCPPSAGGCLAKPFAVDDLLSVVSNELQGQTRATSELAHGRRLRARQH